MYLVYNSSVITVYLISHSKITSHDQLWIRLLQYNNTIPPQREREREGGGGVCFIAVTNGRSHLIYMVIYYLIGLLQESSCSWASSPASEASLLNCEFVLE